MFNKKIAGRDERPVFPKRAIITAGMPYGNKHLHFGHVGGMFIHADVFARFMRDRIGKENVIFVSGTDCYGSPLLESYRKLQESGYKGTIHDLAMENHLHQKKVLEDYGISLNLFGASALGETAKMHDKVSEEVFNKLYDNGYIEKLSTPQFYDEEFKTFLNGRQVVGKCPIEGCCSEKGYADECDLGHQYMPDELINPISTLSGKKPSLREVTNWYFCLEDCTEMMSELNDIWRKETNTRKHQINTIDEFLKKPVLYVPKKYIDNLEELEGTFPEHETINEEKKPSVTFIFDKLENRDKAKRILESRKINYTSGKTLVPFRLSGNVEWGVKVPDKEDEKNVTFWVWPESLWAPVSFTRTYLKQQGFADDEWKKWWDDDDALVYQFIGEDNIYFYAIAEMAMFTGLHYKKSEAYDVRKAHLPHIIANRHLLFMDTKASSSSAIKPPMADELLKHYSAEQLRMHFISLGLSQKSTGFKPQVYMTEEELKALDGKQGIDPVLKEGNLLTNVFNRLVRSCFYALQSNNNGLLPDGKVDDRILELSKKAVLEYERHMYNHDFHRISYLLDEYIREINKHWVNNVKKADRDGDNALRHQILIDCLYGVRVASVLIHPIAPQGCEMIREYLNVGEDFFSWDHILEPISYFTGDVNTHKLKFLEPRVDFFKKPEWQFNSTDENQDA